MNCLADKNELFKTASSADPCTQGVDISNYFVPLTSFASFYGDVVNNFSNKAPFVGFVDVEGQGDRDVAYDANLICPILLTSKCVLFNWKGSLQKDKILNLLGVMYKAALHVAQDCDVDDNVDVAPLLGHLHIVFRDWQHSGTPDSVKATLFNKERSAESDARLRNSIREDILSTFESITVWLLPTPSTKVIQSQHGASTHGGAITLTECNSEFKGEIKKLRKALVAQLSNPTTFGRGKYCIDITGSNMGRFVATIVNEINDGNTIKPQSAYLSMKKQEMDEILIKFDEDAAKVVESLLRTNDSNDLMPSLAQIDMDWKKEIEACACVCMEKLKSVIGGLEGSEYEVLLMTPAIARIEGTSTDKHKSIMYSYKLKQQAQLKLFTKTCRDRVGLFYSDGTVDQDVDTVKEAVLQIDSRVNEYLLKQFTAPALYNNEELEDLNNALENLQNYRAVLSGKLSNALESVASSYSAFLRELQDGMKSDIALYMNTESCGVKLVDVVNTLNEIYFIRRDQINSFKDESIPGYSTISGALLKIVRKMTADEFHQYCLSLSKELPDLYRQHQTCAVETAVKVASASIVNEWNSYSTGAAVDKSESLKYLEALYQTHIEKIKESTCGWTIWDGESKHGGDELANKLVYIPLRSVISSCSDSIEVLKPNTQRKKRKMVDETKEAVDVEPVPEAMEYDLTSEMMDVEDDMLSMDKKATKKTGAATTPIGGRGASGRNTSAGTSTSVEEQRSRAKKWAAQKTHVDIRDVTAGSKTSRPLVETTVKPSVAEQRKRAAEWHLKQKLKKAGASAVEPAGASTLVEKKDTVKAAAEAARADQMKRASKVAINIRGK